MRLLKGLGDLLDLAGGVLRTEVDGGADSGRTEVVRLLRRAEHDLVVLGRVGEQLVVVELGDERDLVGVAPADHPEHSERGGEGIAAPLDGQLDQVLGVEVGRVAGE